MADNAHGAVERFIERWQNAGGSERANYQLFVHELWKDGLAVRA